ncbi:basic-leucine zipper transcription factor [Fusarium langsethiae]|uniref:Basic-leucine zipper transcription factor n=1 Tax=Fusarium langsethiae TaxID=179993 RepID=A0A0M9EM30_FUSLA|nr:basic-leucine zipper transcription factor [Fusarium langsethiae]
MELPTYAVSQSLLASRSVTSPRGDRVQQPVRAPTNGTQGQNQGQGQDGRSQVTVTGKRKRTNPGHASKESSSRSNGFTQYAVPASFQSPQIVQYSPPSQTLRTPPSNDIDDLPVNSRSEPVYLTLGTPCEAQSRSLHHPAPGDTIRQTQEQLQLHTTRIPASQFLNHVPNFAYQSTDKDVAMKQNYFSDSTFFPSPAITDTWGELPTPDLSAWDTTTRPRKQSYTYQRGELASDNRSAQDVHNATSTTGDTHLEPRASMEDRLSHVLKAVDAAGFDSLDSAVIAYYQRSSKGNDWLRQEQRLNRMRRLPVLLKELHLAAQGWGHWERRNFQEQIIKSTEDILFAELEDHLATRRSSPHDSPCSIERVQGHQHMTEHGTDPEAELPNTWTLLTSLSTGYSTIASQDLQTEMPRLVGKFLAAGTELNN